MFILTRVRRFIEKNLIFTVLLLTTAVFIFVAAYALVLQAQRVYPGPPSRSWKAWFIIACYIVLALVTLVVTGRRARILVLRLKRLPRKEGKAPFVVRQFVQDEFWRTAAIAYVSQPKGTRRAGWGAPGTPYEGLNFRRAILDTVPIIDAQARVIAPRLAVLRPQMRIGQHLRGLSPLLGPGGLSWLRDYDASVQLARYSKLELSEEEFEKGASAFRGLLGILGEYRDDAAAD